MLKTFYKKYQLIPDKQTLQKHLYIRQIKVPSVGKEGSKFGFLFKKM